MFYTYSHETADTGKIFYIGKGIDRRHKRTVSRNPHWHNIVNKHGFVSKILAHWKTEREALQHESFLISCFKDMGLTLANKTDGGESGSGYVMPESEKIKRRNFRHTEETKAKISKSSKEFWATSPSINKEYITEDYKQKKRKISLKNGNRPPIHFGENQPMAKKVRCLENGLIFNTAKEAAKWVENVRNKKSGNSLILSCCKGKFRTAYKFHWEYV